MKNQPSPPSPLAKSILTAFDRHTIRYFENLFSKLESPNVEDRKKVFLTAYREQQFLLRRATEPAFYRKIMRRMNSSPIISNYRTALLSMILESIFRGKVNVEYLVSGAKDQRKLTPGRPRYSRRQVQRLFHEYFAELIFERPDSESSRDSKVKDFSTVFSPHIIPTVSTSEAARQYYELDKARLWQNNKALTGLFYHSVLILMMPETTADFIKFRKEIQNAMPSLISSLELDPEAESTMMSFDVSNVFHRHLNSILALAWFRSRHSKEQTRILSMRPTSFYGTKDAHNAFELLESIPELKSRQFRLGMIAASALHFFNSKDACLLVYNECLHLPDISEEDIATANENIGIIHRENGHYKLMVRFMRKALDSYRKSGNVYRECVCLKNLGEAVYALGFEEAGLKHLQESDARGLALPDPRDRFGVQYNLAESWRRLKNRDQELIHLNKCFKILKESEIEIPEDQLVYINQRIIQLG